MALSLLLSSRTLSDSRSESHSDGADEDEVEVTEDVAGVEEEEEHGLINSRVDG
jgi:hypothetical protein